MTAAAHRRAPSTIFDVELDDDGLTREASAALRATARGVLVELLGGHAAASGEAQRRLRDDAEAAAAASSAGDGHVDLAAFAQQLADAGHPVWLRTGKPEAAEASSVVALRHTFVVAGTTAATASAGDDGGGAASTSGTSPTSSSASGSQQQQQQQQELFVVDPCFKDSFLLSGATPAYAALLDALPALFVGTAEQLLELVEYLCGQMQLVFAETGTSCPPWRTPAMLATKWLPLAAVDVHVAPHGGGGNTAAAALAGAAAPPRSEPLPTLAQLRSASSASSDSARSVAAAAAAAVLAIGGGAGSPATPPAPDAAMMMPALAYTPRATAAAAGGARQLRPFETANTTAASNILLSGSVDDLGAGLAGERPDLGAWDSACCVVRASVDSFGAGSLKRQLAAADGDDDACCRCDSSGGELASWMAAAAAAAAGPAASPFFGAAPPAPDAAAAAPWAASAGRDVPSRRGSCELPRGGGDGCGGGGALPSAAAAAAANNNNTISGGSLRVVSGREALNISRFDNANNHHHALGGGGGDGDLAGPLSPVGGGGTGGGVHDMRVRSEPVAVAPGVGSALSAALGRSGRAAATGTNNGPSATAKRRGLTFLSQCSALTAAITGNGKGAAAAGGGL